MTRRPSPTGGPLSLVAAIIEQARLDADTGASEPCPSCYKATADCARRFLNDIEAIRGHDPYDIALQVLSRAGHRRAA